MNCKRPMLLLKSRGRLEARTAIDFCENQKFTALGVHVNRNSRKITWEKVFVVPDFHESQAIAMTAPSLMVANNKSAQFGLIVESIYCVQNKTIHSIARTPGIRLRW
ncbi:unnamed protein product [Auanema sp. JU1783]|nr:unnamed protein product [Auanema sp. JU1783]